MNLDFNTLAKMTDSDDIEFMMKCTFCTEPATTELTVKVGPDMVVPMPSCESCRADG
ncbi:hypothetical protein SEA_WOFFORD_148 [Streptomyces phage Wofford]|uniref:Uncharacterized protein n=1 Tax=Streptomyces phage Wofford TaxID=2283267 RepID=A0A345M9Z0_9CAUD|nr:hypothetical protein HWB78_gp144 [Streptomyces phage Wollford]AXH67311.1 hypothetical protein SEA_WOFFORD_148 [Streptomyces phage Wollford]